MARANSYAVSNLVRGVPNIGPPYYDDGNRGLLCGVDCIGTTRPRDGNAPHRDPPLSHRDGNSHQQNAGCSKTTGGSYGLTSGNYLEINRPN